jgi:ABC-type glycerol-3-phosphate transport system substrate-binding protein
MKNQLRRLSAALLALMLLAGCGEKGSEDGNMLDPENPVTISVWTYYNGAQQGAGHCGGGLQPGLGE